MVFFLKYKSALQLYKYQTISTTRTWTFSSFKTKIFRINTGERKPKHFQMIALLKDPSQPTSRKDDLRSSECQSWRTSARHWQSPRTHSLHTQAHIKNFPLKLYDCSRGRSVHHHIHPRRGERASAYDTARYGNFLAFCPARASRVLTMSFRGLSCHTRKESPEHWRAN